MELPRDLTENADLRGSEYGWPLEHFPTILAKAEELGLACLGGQFQFRVPAYVCEMYWLNADPTPRRGAEEWESYARRSCREVGEEFSRLWRETDFLAEAARWSDVPELVGPSAAPLQYLCFVAYFVSAEAAPNNSSKPTPLRGAA